MNPKVDRYFSELEKWQEELEQLRHIVLDCGLEETLKWRQPCYTFQQKNIILISCFKDYCVISFFKGTLLKDTDDILEKPGENTQAARIIRFTNVQEILRIETILKAYIYEAIEVEKLGLKVNFNKNIAQLPEELEAKLDESPSLKKAFYALTPGRQKGYILYFSAPKQSKTRMSRIEKYTQRILNGKGFHDCVCGLSQKMPQCDGSHKSLKK